MMHWWWHEDNYELVALVFSKFSELTESRIFENFSLMDYLCLIQAKRKQVEKYTAEQKKDLHSAQRSCEVKGRATGKRESLQLISNCKAQKKSCVKPEHC